MRRPFSWNFKTPRGCIKMEIVVPEFLRELSVHLHDHPHGKAWLSAASGLVCAGDRAYVIADDEHHLGCFSLRATANPDALEPLTLMRLFTGDLPEDKKQRKKAKPDLESLSLLPPLAEYPHGALLALGSGSKPTRYQGVLIPFDKAGELLNDKIQLDLNVLYEPLQKQFGDLNIEGTFVTGGEFHLLQRGNKSKANSARISYPWPAMAAWLTRQELRPPAAMRSHNFALGSVGGVPLSITDAAALQEGWWIFCAVAENTDDSYHDGACMASIVGTVRPDGQLAHQYRLQGDPKVEGIAVVNQDEPLGGGLQLLLVTDADDPKIASQLLRVVLQL
jgi:hypothetical protein